MIRGGNRKFSSLMMQEDVNKTIKTHPDWQHPELNEPHLLRPNPTRELMHRPIKLKNRPEKINRKKTNQCHPH